MTENMKKLLEAMSKDQELSEKASKLDKDALIALARKLGIELTEADFVQPGGELNADELEVVAGGGICACSVGGGGTKGDDYPACACVLAGFGKEHKKGNYRCACPLAGVGEESLDALVDGLTPWKD